MKARLSRQTEGGNHLPNRFAIGLLLFECTLAQMVQEIDPWALTCDANDTKDVWGTDGLDTGLWIRLVKKRQRTSDSGSATTKTEVECKGGARDMISASVPCNYC